MFELFIAEISDIILVFTYSYYYSLRPDSIKSSSSSYSSPSCYESSIGCSTTTFELFSTSYSWVASVCVPASTLSLNCAFYSKIELRFFSFSSFSTSVPCRAIKFAKFFLFSRFYTMTLPSRLLSRSCLSFSIYFLRSWISASCSPF